ncbi:GntR family transcriptional regulator [Sporanaerobium hydrogeniformans]|uniref:GntR family transcriptional regulator n=1 Tax=Sporanaerobium hydrogeniformans TaxID=3072179 RepID=UPI0015D47417|nr:substrate-binding domain-containing protein [Sporanaerobium hydrogeniformans]
MKVSKSSLPLYKQIYEDLKIQIQENHYEEGSFLPAERVLSEHYQVERLTLRKALALLAEEGYLQKLPGAGNKVLRPASFNVTSQEAHSIAYILPTSSGEEAPQPYHMEICNYLEKYCKEEGLDLIFTKVSPSSPLPAFLANPSSIKGIIWVGDIDASFLELARLNHIPSIVISNQSPHFACINNDDINCSYTATEHLIQKGCKKIVHIAGLIGYISRFNRVEGYRRALLVNGLTYSPEYVVSGDWSFTSGYNSISTLLEKGIPFDGIAAANDMMALGAMKAVVAAGLKVPEDVKIIGIDNIDQSKTSIPALTTVCIEQRSIAQLAFLFLKQAIAGTLIPEEVLIPGRLIVRETT